MKSKTILPPECRPNLEQAAKHNNRYASYLRLALSALAVAEDEIRSLEMDITGLNFEIKSFKSALKKAQ